MIRSRDIDFCNISIVNWLISQSTAIYLCRMRKGEKGRKGERKRNVFGDVNSVYSFRVQLISLFLLATRINLFPKCRSLKCMRYYDGEFARIRFRKL